MIRAALLAAAAATLAGCGAEPAQQSREMSANEVAAELAAVQVRPGLWEVRSEVVNVSAPDLPREVLQSMTGQRSSDRTCITPEEAARPDANFLAMREDSNCTHRDFSMRDGRLRGTMTCAGGEEAPGEMVATMDGQYGTESYDMRMRMEMRGAPGQPTMTIETRVVGRRVGDCPA